MKSTYKLLGVEWDHMPIPENIPPFAPFCEVPDYMLERNLFDIECYKRQIRIMQVLSEKDLKEICQIAEKCRECDRVYLTIDFEPRGNLLDVLAFFSLRALQIYELLRKYLSDTELYIMGTDRMKQHLISMWDNKMCA